MPKYTLNTLSDLEIDIQKPSIIFLEGDLGAGKTTLTKHIISRILGNDREVTSPTYTYYNKIDDIYHFDLYRLNSYDEFVAIGGEEILDNNEGIIIIEWPQIIASHYQPDIHISLDKTSKKGERDIEVTYN